jgi:hypothetical protein
MELLGKDKRLEVGDWRLGFGDWGLEVGDRIEVSSKVRK